MKIMSEPLVIVETVRLRREFGDVVAVDALRACMLQNGTSVFGLGVDAVVVLAAFLVLLALAAWRYPTLVQ
jgi:hypothetical protein